MTPKLRELVRAVKELRAQQRAFFASSPGTGERSRALYASKALEKKVDELIADPELAPFLEPAPPSLGPLFER